MPVMKQTDYERLTSRLSALLADETDEIAIMSTMACELYHQLSHVDWAGFYRVTSPELLTIGPYQGGHGCLRIDFSRGVCGACARERAVQIVDDVESFPGHIACSSTTRSEIVLPVINSTGVLLGVLDLDADQPAAFDQFDADWLSKAIAQYFSGVHPVGIMP